MLDYGFCSPAMRPWVRHLRPKENVAWKTHVGIEFSLGLPAHDPLIRVMEPLFSPAVQAVKFKNLHAPGLEWPGIPWARAKALPRPRVCSGGRPWQMSCWPCLSADADVGKVSNDYAEWVTAAEWYHAAV